MILVKLIFKKNLIKKRFLEMNFEFLLFFNPKVEEIYKFDFI